MIPFITINIEFFNIIYHICDHYASYGFHSLLYINSVTIYIQSLFSGITRKPLLKPISEPFFGRNDLICFDSYPKIMESVIKTSEDYFAEAILF